MLDEAFAALDPETKNEIHNELLEMQAAEPRTIVLVTHDLNEAIKLADNIMFMEAGEIRQYASKKDVMDNPASLSVKDYMERRDK